MQQQFQTHKKDFSRTQIVSANQEMPLSDGQVRARVERFAFTANNITYAVVGERIRYWEFFPPTNSDAADWGVIPVWGFAEISESQNNEIKVGERLFGYFPPATELVMTPTNVSSASFIDASTHRQDLPPAYNVYRRVAAESRDERQEAERMLLYPLYLTAFCIHDLFKAQDWQGAEQVIIISASSKTSIGTAFAFTEDPNAPSVIGLTSSRNVDFVNQLGCYESVLSYDELEQIDTNRAALIIDMSGNGDVIGRLHKHLGQNMKFSSHVGITHWDDAAMGPDFIAERSQQFFAPGHIQQRIKEWGGAEFERKTSAFIERAAAASRTWLSVNSVKGLEGLAQIYPSVLQGSAPPNEGIVITL